MSIIALDLDGTLIERAWPGLGEWKDGAIDGVKSLLAAGHTCYVFTARLSPDDWDGKPRAPGELFTQTQKVRNLLDDAGLAAVGMRGKPAYHLLLDDRAMRFPDARKKAWRRMVPKILARLA